MAIPYSRYIFGSVPWYSLLITLGVVFAVFLSIREEKRIGLPKDTILDLSLWIIPIGIVGARLYYVLFSWQQFSGNPVSVLYIWEGGIAIYGAVISGFLTALFFCKMRKLPLLQICDIIAPGLVLAQSIGRWGNYFNMEAYGPAVRNLSLCFFPLCVLIPSAGGNEWHLATFFYESICDFLIFLFLMFARRKWLRKQGDVFCFYVLFYGTVRLFIEELRTDSLYMHSDIRISQLLSCAACLFVHFVFLRRLRFSRIRRIPRFLMLILEGLYFLFSGFMVLYCLQIIPAGLFALRQKLLILAGFCMMTIVLNVLLYGHSERVEVLYADDKS